MTCEINHIFFNLVLHVGLKEEHQHQELLFVTHPQAVGNSKEFSLLDQHIDGPVARQNICKKLYQPRSTVYRSCVCGCHLGCHMRTYYTTCMFQDEADRPITTTSQLTDPSSHERSRFQCGTKTGPALQCR